MDIAYIDSEEVHKNIESDTPFLLIDTLPGDHFVSVHIPGAANTCVYEVTFLDQVAEIVDSPNDPIVLYGAGSKSQDSHFAAEKLIRVGYSNIQVLRGGLEKWRQDGLPLTGDDAKQPPFPATLLELPDGVYQLDRQQSVIGWAGRNQNSTHHGTLYCKEGELTITNHVLSGSLEMDMNSMENINLAGDELQEVLTSHLKSDDFFFVEGFPVASLTIKEGKVAATPYLTNENCIILGELTLRGVKVDLDFKSTLTLSPEGALMLEAHFDLDRTRWGIIYGSARFFEYLGMHQVFDAVSIQLRLQYTKAP